MIQIPEQVGMTGILLIDIAIGVILSILTFSLLASALQEAISAILNYRGTHLRAGIERLLKDDDVAEHLFNHPLIEGLKGPRNRVQRLAAWLVRSGEPAGDDRLPSSIPRASFARALVESLIERRDALRGSLGEAEDAYERAIEHVDGEIDRLALDHRMKGRLKGVLREVDLGKEEIETALAERLAGIETDLGLWFDNAMDRVGGWYARRAKTVLFCVGFLLAMAVNFDVISYAHRLAEDDALRATVVAEAQGTRAGSASTAGLATGESREAVQAVFDRLDERATTLGWGAASPETGRAWLSMILSWFLIGLGCTFGGPFWYDMLRSLLKVRATAAGAISDEK